MWIRATTCKNKGEAMIQTVMTASIALRQAVLIDHEALQKARTVPAPD